MDETRLLELTAQAGEYALKYYKPRGPLAYAFRNLRDARFAALIRDEVLEEAARVCEALVYAKDHAGNEYRREATASQCAAAIRAAKESYIPAADEKRVMATALRQSVRVVDAKEGS